MEYFTKFKSWCITGVFLLSIGFLASCSQGKDPGDVNVEHASDKDKDPANLRNENNNDKDNDKQVRDSLEQQHYDHTDHENHEDNVE